MVRGFDAGAVRAYMDDHYVGDHMVFAAGNVDHNRLVDLANDRFHDLQRAARSNLKRRSIAAAAPAILKP